MKYRLNDSSLSNIIDMSADYWSTYWPTLSANLLVDMSADSRLTIIRCISWPMLADRSTGVGQYGERVLADMLIEYRPIVSTNTQLRGAQITQDLMIVLFQDLVAILKSCSSTEREIFDMVIRYLQLICTSNILWLNLLSVTFMICSAFSWCSYLFLLSTLIYNVLALHCSMMAGY